MTDTNMNDLIREMARPEEVDMAADDLNERLREMARPRHLRFNPWADTAAEGEGETPPDSDADTAA